VSEPYNNLQQALLSVELAHSDLRSARQDYDTGKWSNFVMRVKWASAQLQSAVARLEEEKEPEAI
jgi:hypothetical protein